MRFLVDAEVSEDIQNNGGCVYIYDSWHEHASGCGKPTRMSIGLTAKNHFLPADISTDILRRYFLPPFPTEREYILTPASDARLPPTCRRQQGFAVAYRQGAQPLAQWWDTQLGTQQEIETYEYGPEVYCVGVFQTLDAAREALLDLRRFELGKSQVVPIHKELLRVRERAVASGVTNFGLGSLYDLSADFYEYPDDAYPDVYVGPAQFSAAVEAMGCTWEGMTGMREVTRRLVAEYRWLWNLTSPRAKKASALVSMFASPAIQRHLLDQLTRVQDLTPIAS